MVKFYAGSSVLYDGEHFLDEELICIHSSLDAVQMYMERIRKYPIINLDDPDYAILAELRKQITATKRRQVVGAYGSFTFPDSERASMWLDGLNREWFYMVPHDGGIDGRISGVYLKPEEELHVPAIVEYIIGQEDDKFRAELDGASHTLKKLMLYINTSPTYTQYTAKIVETVNLIDKHLLKSDANEMLPAEISMRHPILFCGEDEYRVDVRRAIQYAQMDREYARHMQEDD